MKVRIANAIEHGDLAELVEPAHVPGETSLSWVAGYKLYER